MAKRSQTQKAMRAAVESASRDGQLPKENDIITLFNGIKLRLKGVPSLAVREAVLQIPMPDVPRVFIEEKGREEENASDPDYLKAREEAEEARALAANDIVLLLGSEIEEVPEGIDRVEDDGWIDDLRFFGIGVDAENPRARKLAWLKFYALRTDDDTFRMLVGPLRSVGVTEEDVARAVQSFRRGALRRTDTGGEPPA